jgi:protein PhnA
MDIEQALITRSEEKCELCGSTTDLAAYEVSGPPDISTEDQSALICDTCRQQIEGDTELDENHWRCLNDSMWSPVPAIQVLAYRQLNVLSATDWAPDLLDMLYLEDETLAWARQGLAGTDNSDAVCKDSNGATLSAGDTVTLIKDLAVKGANFTAKRGTTVKNISLTDNPEQIEGKVNGTRIVLLSKFLKKA